MSEMFAFKLAEPAAVPQTDVEVRYDAASQRAVWKGGEASLYATCTRSSWGQPGCTADGIQCYFGGAGGWYAYECDYL